MLNGTEIWRRNAETFRDERTGEHQSLFLRYFVIVATAFVLGLGFRRASGDMLTGIVAIQSILIGFSYSTMISVATNDGWNTIDDTVRESKILNSRLNCLAKEIFDNLAYYNFVAILSLATCLLAFLLTASTYSSQDISGIVTGLIGYSINMNWLDTLTLLVTTSTMVLLYGLLIESLFTFARTVRRTTYFFTKRLQSN